MSFDVEVPARETLIVENNFDLDKSGHLFMATEGAVRKARHLTNRALDHKTRSRFQLQTHRSALSV